jgi:TfoX/Sxy family transcriptional regulator of competence genes
VGPAGLAPRRPPVHYTARAGGPVHSSKLGGVSSAGDGAQERYVALVRTLLETTDAVEATRKGFGERALWIDGRIFVMLAQGRLVVKLPRQRVDALVAAGAGQRFDPGHGRLMKEWLSLEPGEEERWLPLALEALEFGRRR